MRVPGKDMSVHVSYLDLYVAVVAQNVSYSPDVADDMVGRAGKLLNESLYALASYGLVGDSDDDDDDEFGPVPDREVMDPRIVRLMDEQEGFDA